LGHGFAGDIAVSLDIATSNAGSLGHSVGQEVRILVLHGIMHLAGYDHEEDQGEMAAREARLRQRFKLPVGLIERAGKNRAIW
jgi:probable rRNA maturation factor